MTSPIVYSKFSANQRKILNHMRDGKRYTAAGLQKKLNIATIGATTTTLNWLCKFGMAKNLGHEYRLTKKGIEHAENLDAGHDGVPEPVKPNHR